jgi:hypothetical protein
MRRNRRPSRSASWCRARHKRLQCVLCNSAPLGSFTGGISLHIVQNKRSAQQRRELIQVFADYFSQLGAHENLLRVWPAIREALRGRQLVLARRLIQRDRRASFGTSPPHRYARRRQCSLHVVQQQFYFVVDFRRHFSCLGIDSNASGKVQRVAHENSSTEGQLRIIVRQADNPPRGRCHGL